MLGLKRIGQALTWTGIALLLVAGASWVRARDEARALSTGDASKTASPASATPRPSLAIQLGPTAQAAATWLPAPTSIPTAGPAAPRPGAAARIVIAAIGVDARIAEVGWHVERTGDQARGVWDTLAGAAGHHRGSADPGQAGNCVLSAHSSDAGGAVFRGLEQLVSGDRVEVYSLSGQRFTYAVTTTLTLDEVGASADERRQHAQWLDPTAEPVLTLVTCWPTWAYTHRIVVRASLYAP